MKEQFISNVLGIIGGGDKEIICAADPKSKAVMDEVIALAHKIAEETRKMKQLREQFWSLVKGAYPEIIGAGDLHYDKGTVYRVTRKPDDLFEECLKILKNTPESEIDELAKEFVKIMVANEMPRNENLVMLGKALILRKNGNNFDFLTSWGNNDNH